MIALVGIDPDSDGLPRAARKHGVPPTIDTGIEGLLARTDLMDQIELIFDATTAPKRTSTTPPLIERVPARSRPRPHPRRDRAVRHPDREPQGTPRRQRAQPQHGDLRRAGDDSDRARDCARFQPVEYGEIVATIASKSAGPGTRANIDEFTETTAPLSSRSAGRSAAKPIIILNPAEPPLLMRDTSTAWSPPPPRQPGGDHRSGEQMVAEVATTFRGTSSRIPVTEFDGDVPPSPGGDPRVSSK